MTHSLRKALLNGKRVHRTKRCWCVGIVVLSAPLSHVSQEQRKQLPIFQYREKIIEMLEESQVLVLSGETGWSVLFKLANAPRAERDQW